MTAVSKKCLFDVLDNLLINTIIPLSTWDLLMSNLILMMITMLILNLK